MTYFVHLARHSVNSFSSDNSPNKVLRVSNIRISSDPVHIPGPETFSGDLEILRPVSGNHFRLDVVIEKHVLFGYPDMPCLTAAGQKVGSWYVLLLTVSLYADADCYNFSHIYNIFSLTCMWWFTPCWGWWYHWYYVWHVFIKKSALCVCLCVFFLQCSYSQVLELFSSIV